MPDVWPEDAFCPFHTIWVVPVPEAPVGHRGGSGRQFWEAALALVVPLGAQAALKSSLMCVSEAISSTVQKRQV